MSNRRTGEAAPGTVQAVHKYDPCLLVQLGWRVPISHKNVKFGLVQRINVWRSWAGCSDCHLRQNYFILDKYLFINHDFRFLAPICICTLGISKYLLIFGFVNLHVLDIWKNLYLQIEKTHFQKPTLFVWWCFTEKCHALYTTVLLSKMHWKYILNELH